MKIRTKKEMNAVVKMTFDTFNEIKKHLSKDADLCITAIGKNIQYSIKDKYAELNVYFDGEYYRISFYETPHKYKFIRFIDLLTYYRNRKENKNPVIMSAIAMGDNSIIVEEIQKYNGSRK